MSDDIVETIVMKGKSAEEIRRLREESEKFYKQAEMNARLLTENSSLRAENENLRLELDMQQATILVPSQKDDQRRIERLNSALVEALDEAALLRKENEKLRAAFRVNMLRAFPNMSHDEIDAEIAAAIRESGE